MQPFTFLKDTATADVAFKAYGKTQAALCKNSALALESVMADLKTIKPKIRHTIRINDKDFSQVLFKFLDELVFLKDAKQLLFSKLTCKITKDNDQITLTATLLGDKINPKTQKLGDDVKAITYHMFEVKHTKDGYTATVLVDV